MAGSILGNRVTRTEDPELLTRGGTYVYDLPLERPLHAVFVRSPYAHARIRGVEVGEAVAMAGVAAVWTAADLDIAPHHGFVKVDDAFARAPLAAEVVRFVGDPVAVVLADDLAAAVDAAEAVVVDYDPLPVVVDPERAFDDDAPVLFPDHGSNLALAVTDPVDDDLFADAEVVVRGRYVNQRLAPVPIEPNSAAAVPGGDGSLTFYAATQMPHGLRYQLAKALDMDRKRLRVVAPHVGGGFGAKAGLYHEHPVLATAALRLGRPVTWTESRSEDMVALYHSRAQIQYAELGLRRDGTFTALRVRLVGDAGAYPNVGAMLPAGTKRMANGPYALPKLRFDVAVATTNTTPTGAYRGAGRPEATALLERVVDHAAHELGIDPVEIRRRNLLADDLFPFDTLTGLTYDTGEYRKPLEEAARLVGYDELRREQEGRRQRGESVLLGVGVASYVEVTSGGGGKEYAAVEVHPDGWATVKAGTSAHGQGHQTAFAMLVADQTGIPVDRVRLVQSDTALVPRGGGTGGSRSLQLGGSAVKQATEAMVARARDLAAHLLEANPADVVVDVDAATVGVVGVPAKAMTWAELATAAQGGMPDEVAGADDDLDGLAAQVDFSQADGTFPFGTHIAVVEVDTETGLVRLVRHVAVDDAGTVLNPLLVEGQQHGGIAQGAAQALFEEVVYDDDGNLRTASLMDYLVPSAAEFGFFEAHSTETPTPLNPLGAKGIGEAATIGATPAVQNAVIDALAHLGVRHLDMPCTPQRVWAAVEAARRGELPAVWREPPSVFDRLAAGQEADAEGLAAAESI